MSNNTAHNHLQSGYRGRIAPSPTGFLHLGHALTFRTAQERARAANGCLLLRIEDLDRARCKPEFVEAVYEDLRWFGLDWDEGPDCGGEFAPYLQSLRRSHYLDVWEKLRAKGLIYPCRCSRRDIQQSVAAPHPEDEEPVYPATCRPSEPLVPVQTEPGGITWRFRVPGGLAMSFEDGRMGAQKAVSGVSFGDFIVWRKDDVPAYQLAVVADDAAMKITEVVRGEDLLVSTFRQLLLYDALGLQPPSFYHCPLIRDAHGVRLAKRHAALSLRELRKQGQIPGDLLRIP